VGFLDQSTGAVQWLPRGAAMVMTPDGYLWGTSRTSDDKQVLSRFDPKSYEVTNYSVANGGGITKIVNGPNGCLWYLDQAGSLGTYCPNNGYNAEYPLQGLKYPESLYTGTDGNLWVSNAEQMVKFNTAGQAVGVFPLIWPQIQDWAQAPDGSAWTVANSDDADHPRSLVRLNANLNVCQFYYRCGTTYLTPKLSTAFDGVFDSHGNLWYRAQNGGDNVIIRFNPTTQASTQYEAPYRSAAPITVGTDGQIWSGGAYNDNRLLAVSTGSGPAEAPPSLGASVYVGVVATCSPATWAGTATVVRRYWTNAATGKVLAQGDTFTPGSDLQSQMIQCTEVATLPWVEAPLTATSSPAMVRRRYSTSGAMREQSPTKAFALPDRIAAKGTTTLVPTAVMTTAGQRATVTVTATHTGSAKRAQAKEWTLLRRNGAVKVRVHTKRPLTLLVGVKAPRKGKFAPLEMTRVYRIEPGRRAARRLR
jgi:streptogramin lyase